jgi:L,D-peptidoglycan transpeptidase YkuD (ErfK/YbiS/YcfS/YnhG family)
MSRTYTAHADGRFDLGGRKVRCALGKGGVIDASDKREGDGCTPLGLWPMRKVLYRADRGPKPSTRLPAQAIARNDGWCDHPGDSNYNRPVKLPYPASAEKMWREDELYDLVVVLGYNDAPVRPGRGSAIFLHCARPRFTPTAGCVAIAKPELFALLARLAPGDAVAVTDSVSLAGMD